MRSNTSWVMGALILFLIIGHPVAAQEEKAPRWLDPILSSLKQGKNLAASQLQRSAIEKIQAHLLELQRLEAQGLNQAEIQAHFEPRMTKPGPMGLAGSFAATPSGALSGTLSEVGGGQITYYASVTAYDEFGNYAGYASTSASKKGKYKIEGLLSGKYYVYAGSYYYGYKYFRNTTDWRKAKLVRVKNKAKKGINFRFEVKRGSGAISGFIRRSSGTPVLEAEISAYDSDYDLVASGTADTNGGYLITDLPSGQYRLRAIYRVSGEIGNRWYKNAKSFEDADPVDVTEPDTTPGINFVIPPGGTISGKIISSTGKPVEAYSTYVEVYDTKQKFIRSTSVGDKGRFSCAELDPGRYKLRIEYSGQENNLSAWYPNAQTFKKAKAIRIVADMTKSLRIKLKRGGIIAGQVMNYDGQAAPSGCMINIYDLDGRYATRDRVRPDGTFEASSLASGSYKLFVDTSYASSYPGESPCDEWYDGSQSFEGATPIHVLAPQTTGNISIQLERGGYISGRVVIGGGSSASPYGDVDVYDMRGNFVRYGEFWYDGSYMVDGLPSGTYRLRATSWEGDHYMSVWYGQKQNFAAATSVSVSSPYGPQGIDMTLEPEAHVYGFLTDSKGRKLSNEETDIRVYAFDAGTGEYAANGNNSFTGGYRMDLLRGSYKLAALRYKLDNLPEQKGLSRVFYPGGAEFYSPENHIVWTAPSDRKKLNKIVMKPASGSISGTILDQNTGLPLEASIHIVLAFDQNGFLAAISGCSECNGAVSDEYRLTGLRPGTYYLVLIAMYDCSYMCKQSRAWYGGATLSEEEAALLMPKTIIPNGAVAIVVGEGVTSGIDFYMEK